MSTLPVDSDLEQSEEDFKAISQYRLIDDYVIKDGQIHPFAVIIPGGGYNIVANFIEGIPIAKRLNSKGISSFIVYYRTKEEARYPAPMDDLARAIRQIFDNATKYNIDTSNYSIWGSSAGGHLTSSFGTDNMGYKKYGLPKPKALILSYPVITMDKDKTHQGSHDLLLGENATKEQEKNVFSDFPLTYIWCGDKDVTVHPDNSKMLAEALKKSKVPVKIEIFPDVAHGVGPATGTSAEGWINNAVDFWMS